MAGRRWSDLDERRRRLIVFGAVVETILKTAALVDLTRRPAAQIRGPKWAWVAFVTLVNAVGAAPLAYFLVGRTAAGEGSPQASVNGASGETLVSSRARTT